MTLPFDYTLKKHRSARNLKIKIESNGQVIVTAPAFIPKIIIDQFVKNQQQWILEHLAKQKNVPKFVSKTDVSIFGKKYQKKIEFSMKKKVGIYVKNEDLIFNPTTEPVINSTESEELWNKKFNQKLEQFLKNSASHYIIKRTFILAEKMNLKFNKITLKKQKTRWGSCSSQKNLNFNWQLVHFETPIIDYVIIHELSHLVHMNHGKQFWSLVEKFDPEYKKHVGWLKRNGMNLG